MDQNQVKNYLLAGNLSQGYRPSTLVWPLWYWAGQQMLNVSIL